MTRTSLFRVFRLVAFLVILSQVCVAFPVDTPLQVHPDAILDKNVEQWAQALEIGCFIVLLVLILIDCWCTRKPPSVGVQDDSTPLPPYDDSAPPAYNTIRENEENNNGMLSVFVIPASDTPRVTPKTEEDISHTV